MTRTDYSTEQFAAFLGNLKESFWGDLQGQARQTLKTFLEVDAEQQMEQYLGLRWYERPGEGEVRADSRNGFYERDYVTPLGVIRLRVPRTPELAELIRQAFLRGIATRQVGRVVALLTVEPVSAQTVSRLRRVLDAQLRAFHQAELGDDWAYLFLDGVWIKLRRGFGPQRVLLLVAYGEHQVLGFVRARGESQATWEGALQSFFRCGQLGRNLQLIITDGCAGLAAALQTAYPGVPHQRCWVHKMRNICAVVRRRDHEAVKHDAQKIYQAPSLAEAREASRNFQRQWQSVYPRVVKSLEKDLPDLLKTSLPSPSTCGRNCAPPMPSSAASRKCAAGRGPWSS